MTTTKPATDLTTNDVVYYPGYGDVTVLEIVSDTAVVGFYYEDGDERLYGHFEIDSEVEITL